MRFTLRDLFWLTVVVALALGWAISGANWQRRMVARYRHAEALRTSLYNAWQNHRREQPGGTPNPEAPVAWELATMEIP